MNITWNAGIVAVRPDSLVKIKGIDGMEGWDGGTVSNASIVADSIEEEEMGDDTVELGGGGWKDETADPVNAFSFQNELIELDKVFCVFGKENADMFVSALLWDDEKDAPTGESIRIAPGEELRPYRVRIGDAGELQFLVWWSRDELTRAPLMLKRGDLEDVMPETYGLTEANFKTAIKNQKRWIYVLERENRDVIGSRQRVIRSLNTAIKARSEIDLLSEMKRQEAERAKTYEDDDSAGMF
ncbi:MAG: hypothetical protein NXH70_02390 [Hyphomonas sp.]|nr:hypothetical protein [Hyphomonas sp.]